MMFLDKREQFVSAWEGKKATIEQVASLRQRLKTDPLDLDARLRLIGHLFQKETLSRLTSYERFRQVIWIIDNFADFTGPIHDFIALDHIPIILWSTAVEHWDLQIQKQHLNHLVLFNAAMFFSERDFDRAYSIFQAVISLKPESSQYRHVLCMNAYKKMCSTLDIHSRMNYAEITLKSGLARICMEFSTEDDKQEILSKISEASVYLEDFAQAASYANNAFALNCKTTLAISGNLNAVLGLCAIRKNEVELAITYFNRPFEQFSNLRCQLAEELIKQNRTPVVLNSLSAFFKSSIDRSEAEKLLTALRMGLAP